MTSAPTEEFTVSVMLVLNDAPSTLAVLTSVTPIIRAAAVTAVRRGLRSALRTPSRSLIAPGERPADQPGQRPGQQRRQQRHAEEHQPHADQQRPAA